MSRKKIVGINILMLFIIWLIWPVSDEDITKARIDKYQQGQETEVITLTEECRVIQNRIRDTYYNMDSVEFWRQVFEEECK